MRRGCCPREELKRGAWTSQEDKLLSDYIKVHGLGKWRSLPANAGLNRCGKSCRLRWLNYLRPDIKRGNITEEEEELIIRLHKLLGNRWSLIAGRLPGRTDNEIKNYWNTYLRKKVAGASSEQQPPRTKNDLTEKPTAEKKDRSDVSVVRTKAERCMRSLLTDQPPKPAELDSDSFSNTNEHNAFPPFRMDDPWMQELMQNSFLPQDSVDNFQKSIESLKQFGNAEISFKEDNYTTGLLGAGAKESEGLYSFFDPGYWDSLFMAKRA